ncbi:hypothetical protein PHYC_03005 [Phycisphaerales bacterium]|nr:hypothetical protein PHYC_03005 [Phycisphaerales bacterium]
MVRTAALILTLLLSYTSLARSQPPAPPDVVRSFTAKDARTVRFLLLTPPNFDAIKAFPVLLTFPPGKGDEAMVRSAVDEYWRPAAARRGWVIASPIAPEGSSWQKELSLACELLDHLATIVKPENGLIHVAGVSNGGLAAFSLAIDQPGRFASLVVLPGAPASPAEFERLDRLKTVPVTMFVGENDSEFWLPQARSAAARLKDLDLECDLFEQSGQGHRLKIDSAILFDALDARRPAARATRLAREGAMKAVAAVLDDFHDAASKADEVRYFEHFAKDAIFLGTDPTERWNLEQFRAFAVPYFQKGTGWTYAPSSRHVTVSTDGATAWFDEMLDNSKYGACRGSGVLVRAEGTWRVAQYNLSKPLYNDLLDELLPRVREFERTPITK